MKSKIKMIIGLTSLPGGGKDFVGDILSEKYGFFKVTPGDIIREITKKEGYNEITRDIQIKIQRKYRKKYGKDYVMKLTLKRIESAGKEYIAIAGIRLPEDYLFFKRKFKERFQNIFILTDRRIRYKRIIARKREDTPKSYREFIKQDREEIKEFQLDKTKRLSEFKITNNDGRKALEKQIDGVLKKLKFISERDGHS